MDLRRASTSEIHVNPNRPKTPSFSRPPSRIFHRGSVTPSTADTDELVSPNGRESETMFFRFDEKAVKSGTPVSGTTGKVKNATPISITYGSMGDDKPPLETSPLIAGLHYRKTPESGQTNISVECLQEFVQTSPDYKAERNGDLIESQSDAEEEEIQPKFFSKENVKKNWFRQVKVLLLIGMAIVCTIFIITYPEMDETLHQLSLVKHNISTVNLTGPYLDSSLQNRKVLYLNLKGPFTKQANSSIYDIKLTLAEKVVAGTGNDNLGSKNNGSVSDDMPEPVSDSQVMTEYEKCPKPIYLLVDETLFHEDDGNSYQYKIDVTKLASGSGRVNLTFESQSDFCIPLEFSYHFTTDDWREVLCAAIILFLVYGLIIFELVHRTLAGILGSLAAIAVMSAFGMRPTLEKVITWLDVETLSLLFGMMVIVSIFSETGFFDYCALMAYKLAKGKVWPLITLLCLFSTVVSAFLDNVTTILLLSPVTIRLCEVLNLDPKKILIAEVLFSNIGGTATAIGDPPNVIIVSNKDISSKGIDFSIFTGHMTVGIIFITFVGYGLLRLTYRKMQDLENKDPVEITELKHEIDMWRREAHRKVAITREETVMRTLFLQKATVLENTLVRKMYKMKKTKQKNFNEVLADLKKRYRITDKPLLVKSGLVLGTVILMFFLHTFVPGMHVGLGWIALMGAIWLMVLADIQELETILHRVEWSTLIFFAALFSMMEALNELGLIDWISAHVRDIVMGVDPENRMLVAILLILWVAAIASSFIDNIPFTTAMIPVLLVLGDEEKTGLPLLPLVLALAFGACLGDYALPGNGTIIGASANVLCAGIAEQHGYGFSFWDFFKIGFPMMLVTNTVAMVYLLICHVAANWH